MFRVSWSNLPHFVIEQRRITYYFLFRVAFGVWRNAQCANEAMYTRRTIRSINTRAALANIPESSTRNTSKIVHVRFSLLYVPLILGLYWPYTSVHKPQKASVWVIPFVYTLARSFPYFYIFCFTLSVQLVVFQINEHWHRHLNRIWLWKNVQCRCKNCYDRDSI